MYSAGNLNVESDSSSRRSGRSASSQLMSPGSGGIDIMASITPIPFGIAMRSGSLALDVFRREVGDAGDGCVSDGGVHSVMVVAVEEVRKCSGAVAVAGVGPDVGPFVEQGAVEALYLSIGLRSVGPAVLMQDAPFSQCGVEQSAAVAEAVVGEDSFDGDPLGVEPALSSLPEAGRGRAFLVGEDLGVRDAGVGVVCGVRVCVAGWV